MNLQLKKTLKAGATAGLLLSGLLAPNFASAVSIWIDDSSEVITAYTDPANAGTLAIIQEGNGVMGQVDWSYNYTSVDSNAPGSGQSLTYLYNFDDLTLFDENLPAGFVSDTLSVTITGNGNSNVSVDLRFLSGSLDDLVNPLAFSTPPAVLLDECQGNPNCDKGTNPLWIDIGANGNGPKPLSDLDIHISSTTVPEPMTLALMGIGLVALGARRRFS